jgi:hypothetical protein
MKRTANEGPNSSKAASNGRKTIEEVLAPFLPILIGKVTDSENSPSNKRTAKPVIRSKELRNSVIVEGTIADQSKTPSEIRANATMKMTYRWIARTLMS